MQNRNVSSQLALLVWSRCEALYAWPFVALCGTLPAARGWPPFYPTLGVVPAFYAFTGQPVITDTTDMKEDRLAGIYTLGNRLKWKSKHLILTMGVLITGVFLYLLYRYFDFNALLLLIGLPFTVLMLIILAAFYESLQKYLRLVRRFANVYYLVLVIFFITSLWNQ